MCDGASRDEVLFHHHALIDEFGWAAVGVVDDDAWHEGWLYTIGLTAYDQPELVVVGVPPERCGAILTDLVERVMEGETLLPGSVLDVFGIDVEIVGVHPDHLANGLIAAAGEYYEALGWPPGTVDALQVVVPTDLAYCSEHVFGPPRLNDPSALQHPTVLWYPGHRLAGRDTKERGRSVGRDGFEPSKAVPADLQSAPFGHSGTDPGSRSR
jgi:hypothetical protein